MLRQDQSFFLGTRQTWCWIAWPVGSCTLISVIALKLPWRGRNFQRKFRFASHACSPMLWRWMRGLRDHLAWRVLVCNKLLKLAATKVLASGPEVLELGWVMWQNPPSCSTHWLLAAFSSKVQVMEIEMYAISHRVKDFGTREIDYVMHFINWALWCNSLSSRWVLTQSLCWR